MKGRKILISVIGGHDVDKEVERFAIEVGEIVSEVGAILVCGGLGGVMEAVSKGSKKAGGMTIGILPGKDKNDANPFIDIALPTSIGYARNTIVACCADIIIALPGSHGTRSEISYGFVYEKPIIDLGEWGIDGMIKIKNIKELKSVLLGLIKEIQEES
ncbi:MAG: TIGR00725 family protein [Candidatus Omnitrophota bacterium]